MLPFLLLLLQLREALRLAEADEFLVEVHQFPVQDDVHPEEGRRQWEEGLLLDLDRLSDMRVQEDGVHPIVHICSSSSALHSYSKSGHRIDSYHRL